MQAGSLSPSLLISGLLESNHVCIADIKVNQSLLEASKTLTAINIQRSK